MVQTQQRNVEEGIELRAQDERATERLRHLRELFNRYDQNNDGRIELNELKVLIRNNNVQNEIPEYVVRRIFEMSDADGNRYLDYDEFVKMFDNPILKPILGTYINKYINTIIPRRKSLSVRPRSGFDVTDGAYEDEYKFWPPPVGMVLISVVEIILYCIDASYGPTEYIDGPIATNAIFDPKKREEAWRWITYMFVHIGPLHLVVNLLVQILLGVPLEMVHRGWRVLIIYFCGVLAGSLGTSITDPHVKLAGASGGVYALITAHIASVIMNWSEMQFALIQLLVFLVITGIDFGTAIYNRYHDLNDQIGYVAHLAGAIAGLLVGIFILRNLEVNSTEKKLWWVSLILFSALIATAIIWNIAYPSYFG